MKNQVVIVSLLIVLTLVYLFKSPFAALALHSEPIDRHIFGVMMKGIFQPERAVKLSIDGSNYLILLPEGTAKLSDTEYLTSSLDWAAYARRKLAPLGWDGYEQLGAGHLFSRTDNGAHFLVLALPFTGAYWRFKFMMTDEAEIQETNR